MVAVYFSGFTSLLNLSVSAVACGNSAATNKIERMHAKGAPNRTFIDLPDKPVVSKTEAAAFIIPPNVVCIAARQHHSPHHTVARLYALPLAGRGSPSRTGWGFRFGGA